MPRNDALDEEVKTLARDHAEDAIAALAEVMNDSDEKGAARVAAARALLDRGFGAPERRVSQEVNVNVYDQRQAHFEALRRLGEKKKALPKPETKDDVEDAEFTEVEAKKDKAK